MSEITHPTGKRLPIKMDMTPMVDLAFLLLTFFMLTTTLHGRKAMEILMPEKPVDVEPPVVNQERVVTLILGANDKIYWYKGLERTVDQTDYSVAGVRKLLLD